jgi:aromatic-L-amino-acid/L-tryptophan decarboxylase
MRKTASRTIRNRASKPGPAALEMSPRDFRVAGHRLIEDVAKFLESLEKRPVTPGESPREVRKTLGGSDLPRRGKPAGALLKEAANLLFNHSLLNGHPRFWGYITSSAAPAGALADLLASAVNPNAGAWLLSPMASEIEAQTVRWIAEMIGYPTDAGGLLVSGGNMANFVAFLAARKAKAVDFAGGAGGRLRAYCSRETHTWIEKAGDLFGLGREAIRWSPVDASYRAMPGELEKQIEEDFCHGERPFLIVGTAGTVSTGAVDPLGELAEIARRRGLWFHVDGAYGGFAACLPDARADLGGIAAADSVAVDPHKWLYTPLEAGCVLMRDRQALKKAFSFHPAYYRFGKGTVIPAQAGTVAEQDEDFVNYFEWGLQNSRGFRALKVWVGLRQAGLDGFRRMIAHNISLARAMFRALDRHPEIEARTQSLSIVTFRYVPPELRGRGAEVREYLNRLNGQLLDRLQHGGEAFVSNAVLDEDFVLRACIVNFRTELRDVEALPEIVARNGRQLDHELRPREARD